MSVIRTVDISSSMNRVAGNDAMTIVDILCVCVCGKAQVCSGQFHPHPVCPISASRLTDHVPADASQMFSASWSVAAQTVTAQPAVGTQPYGPEGDLMGLDVPPHRPCPDQTYTKEPSKGERACGNTRGGAVVDPQLGMYQRQPRPGSFEQLLSHDTQGNRDNAKIP